MVEKVLKVFKSSYVADLIRDVKTNKNFGKYELENFPYKDNFPKGIVPIDIKGDFDLIIPDGKNNYDFENAVIIYNSLFDLSETQAADPRLWTYLAHVPFWSYMRKRYPIENQSNKEQYLLDHYFVVNNNTRQLIRNGIAGLWWGAKLTYDDNRKDKFELTKVLFKDRDRIVQIIERSLGRNKNIISGYLETIDEQNLSRDRSRDLAKFLNLTGGTQLLSFLSKDDIKNICSDFLS